MSTEAVKRQILIAVDALTVPLDRVPSSTSIVDACSAAKLLRNRLLREHTRVIERIGSLREHQMYDESNDEGIEYDDDDANVEIANSGVDRAEFIFVCEMMVAEKLVIPLLLAHGMRFSDSLLPQLLKLLAVMLLPVPRYSSNEVLQKDLLQKVKLRCGTDDFFTLLVQCVAPITEKRTASELQREDVVVLEIVLTLFAHLLNGRPMETEQIIGAFCRNHGVELLLVVINQNYSRMQSGDTPAIAHHSLDSPNNGSQIKDGEVRENVEGGEISNVESRNCSQASLDVEEDEIDLDGVDSLSSTQNPEIMSRTIDQEFQQQVSNLLESDEQLWKWNCLASASIASVIWCVPAEELAELTLLSDSTDLSPNQLLGAIRSGPQLRDCRKTSDKWRAVARSRNGAVTTNGILVRRNSGGAVGSQAIGTFFSLIGSQRKDPLEAMKDMDLRKKGRLVKGMFQGITPQCNLPLPTKLQLTRQNSSFLSFGFEPLSAIIFSKLQTIASAVERATREHKEVVAGYKSSGEMLEVTSALDHILYGNLEHVLHYLTICRCTLRYVRILAEKLKAEDCSFLTLFPQQWQSVSSIISLDYLELGFSILRSFLDCKDIRRREDITNVVGYLSEILLILHMLLQGEISTDPAVEVAAHALATSVLYKEENIKAVFGVLNEYSSRAIAVRKAQFFTLFTYAVFQLLEKCSYKGNLYLPKRINKKPQTGAALASEAADAAGDGNSDDNESIDSAALEGLEEEMHREMADMIDDGVSDEDGSQNESVQVDANNIPAGGLIADFSSHSGLPGATQVDANPSTDEKEEVTVTERAESEGQPPSIASSAQTAASTLSSERQVAVGSFFQRLASPKNITLVYSALRHWRVNSADVNIALTFLMDSLIRNDCESIFFNVAFLLLMREVIVSGEVTHAPLYAVCDRIVYDFFNPPFAKSQDARLAALLPDDVANGLLNGAQSQLGFEVSLRCTRALFSFSTVDYAYVEEKGMPHLMSYTEIPLPDDGKGGVAQNRTADAAPPVARTADLSGGRSHRRRKAKLQEDEQLLSEDETEASLDSHSGNESAALNESHTTDGEKTLKTRNKRSRDSHQREKKRRKREAKKSANAGEVDFTEESTVQPAAEIVKGETGASSTADLLTRAAAQCDSLEDTLVVEGL